MPNFRKIAPAAYLVAFMLIVIPWLDASLQLYPWAFRSSQWRFGFMGLFANAFMIPLAGVLIAVSAAVLSDHVAARKWISRICWLFALGALGAIVMFALDAVQSSPQVEPQRILSFRVAVLTSTFKLFLTTIAFAMLATASGIPAIKPAKPRSSR